MSEARRRMRSCDAPFEEHGCAGAEARAHVRAGGTHGWGKRRARCRVPARLCCCATHQQRRLAAKHVPASRPTQRGRNGRECYSKVSAKEVIKRLQTLTSSDKQLLRLSVRDAACPWRRLVSPCASRSAAGRRACAGPRARAWQQQSACRVQRAHVRRAAASPAAAARAWRVHASNLSAQLSYGAP